MIITHIVLAVTIGWILWKILQFVLDFMFDHPIVFWGPVLLIVVMVAPMAVAGLGGVLLMMAALLVLACTLGNMCEDLGRGRRRRLRDARMQILEPEIDPCVARPELEKGWILDMEAAAGRDAASARLANPVRRLGRVAPGRLPHSQNRSG
jgi:hypothetical protein